MPKILEVQIYSPTEAWHADKYDAAISVYTAYNDLHRNARKYQIDSQAPESTSHFAMRITLFSSVQQTAYFHICDGVWSRMGIPAIS